MQMRTSKPGAGNKFFIRKANGGYSRCIVGKPTDSQCNVLSNCVGYACGRFNEIIGAMKYPYLNCNAENFIERAVSAGLSIANQPSLGGIMVFQKGRTLSGNDGAGHVYIVEGYYDDGSHLSSESAWGGTAFWNSRRYNTNGRWGMGSGYSFRGCIVNPAIGYVPFVKPAPVDPFKGVSDEELAKRVWNGEFGNGDARKNALGIRYNAVQALVNKGIGKPVAPTPAPQPVIDTLNVGDKVKIDIQSNGYCASADGSARGGKLYKAANGWERYILGIYEGKPFPYQVGLGNITTGFFKKEDIRKI